MVTITFTSEELNLIRQWFNAIEDMAPEYLEDADRQLGKRVKGAVIEAARKISRSQNQS